MKILSSSDIYKADQATIEKTPISSTDLMERAGQKCVDRILNHGLDPSLQVHIFCGMGNNGGDGLVIARLLFEKGYKIKPYIVKVSKRSSRDFQINLKRLIRIGIVPQEIDDVKNFPVIICGELVIDAIFGIGLKGNPAGLARTVIQKINQSGAKIIAIDIPSGLFSESPVTDQEAVIRADLALTFQNPKLAYVLPENQYFIKNWEVLDIGLDPASIEAAESIYHIVDFESVKDILKIRDKFSHKGTHGHALIIGGSFGKIGAAILASKAALKTGSGLVTAYIPKCGYTALQTSTPEIMVEVDDENYLQHFNFKTKATAIGVGVGMGTHSKTKNGFEAFLRRNEMPLVIDADAINMLAAHQELSDLIVRGNILTPHPKEFERLVGPWKNDYDKLDKLLAFSKKHQCLVVLKGTYTTISYQGSMYFNTSGNAGLATAGSGDVLTGIITGLLAQGYEPLDAALLGVYVHGRSADLGIKLNESMESFTASDCIEHLGLVFKEFH